MSDTEDEIYRDDNGVVLIDAAFWHPGHNYVIRFGGEKIRVIFQDGPVEKGVNGIQSEHFMHMLIHRLRHLNSGDSANRETAIAITKIEEALLWLEKRTNDRTKRGVEGKNVR
jgi:hypothetical protein